MPFLEKLLGYFESEAAIIDAQFMTDSREIPGSEGFESCIKFNGEPILPPLMTDEKRSEMQMLRHQAIMAETRMRARARQKLLERVQSVMNSIDQKHAPKSEAVSKENESSSEKVTALNVAKESQSSLMEGIQDKSVPINRDELILPLDLKDQEGTEVENEMKTNASPERQTDSGNKNNTTQSPRTDSGICSRAATSAEMTDVPDDDQVAQEPHLDTMAEISDISSGSENESDERDKEKKESSPKGSPINKQVGKEDAKEAGLNILRKNDVIGEPKGIAFRMAQSLKGKENRVDVLRASGKSTSSSGTTASDEMNKTVISKEDTASNQSTEGLLEILPETEDASPRVNMETQTDKTKASDFEEIITTNKSRTEKSDTGNEIAECGTLLSKVDIGAFSDSMELSDDDDEPNVSTGHVDADKHDQNDDGDKARPKSTQNVISPKMIKDADDIKYVPSPTPSSTPDVSRISAPEEGNGGHNGSMRSEALRASIDFEPDEEENLDNSENDNSNKEPPKCSTRIDDHVNSSEKLSNSPPSPAQMVSKSCADPNSKSSDASTMQTCSTDLGRYMQHSVDTLISSGTTLPHIGDVPEVDPHHEVEDLTPVPEQDEDLASTQKSEISREVTDVNKETTGHVIEGLKPVRRGSYTLEQPSPALVQSQCTADDTTCEDSPCAHQESDTEKEVNTVKRNGKNNNDVIKKTEVDATKENNAPNSESRSFRLTSSMEDLKMKIVQRKLEFDDGETGEESTPTESANTPTVIKTASEKEGKEEHLARYLENLSQLPGMKPYRRKVKHSNTESSAHSKSPGKSGLSEADDLPQDTLEMESTNSQRLSAKFTEQLLNQMHGQDFDVDSLTSPNYYQAQENMTNVSVDGQMSTARQSQEEQYLNTQLDHFKMLRQQLINQQQEQLHTLMVEQQRQQLLFQQEILRQGQSLIQGIQTGTLSVKTFQSRPTDMHAMSMHPLQTFPNASMQSEPQTLPLDLLQHYQQQLVSQSPWFLNSSGSPHVGTEEELLSQFFNSSYQMQMTSQDSEYNQRQSLSSQSRPVKAQSRSNQGQKVSFSIDSNQPQSKSSQRTDAPYMSQDTMNEINSSLNQSDGELDISVVAGVQVPQFPGNVSHTSPRHYPNGTPAAKAQSTPKSALKKTSPRSPRSPRSSPGQKVRISVHEPYISPELHRKFDRITAAVKGYLTRRLLKTDKVQHIIQTIKDTAEFALHFQQETPIKKGQYTNQDRHLLERVLSQLTAAMYEIHEIFFELSVPERMLIIAQSRQQEREKQFKQQQEQKDRRISAATQKAIERRKQAKAAEASVFGDFRPKSAPPQTASPRCDKHTDLTAVAKEHSAMLRHTNVTKRNVTNKSTASKPITKPKKTIGSPVSKTSTVGTKPAMKRIMAPARPKSTAPAWK